MKSALEDMRWVSGFHSKAVTTQEDADILLLSA